MVTVVKGKILEQDIQHWDGITRTGTRKDQTGGTISGNTVGHEIDVLEVYGGGSSYTWQTITDCINRIGTSSRTLVFKPGTWVVDQDLTIGSNFSCRIPAGCVFNVSSGKTLTFSGPVIRDSQTWTSGSGTVTENGTRYLSGKIDLTGSVIQGTSALVFEGSADNAFETTFSITNPTADRTVTFPDADVNLGALATTSGTNNWSGTNTFLTDPIIQSSDAGAAVGPSLIIDRNSASPADSDILGSIVFRGRDDGGGTDTYAHVQAEAVDTGSASEDGKLAIQTAVAGTLATRAYVAQGVVVGSATGGDQGVGTVNATSVYKNGVSLINSDVQEFTSTGAGTWTKPSGYATTSQVLIEIGSAGGSGAFRTGTGNAGGGGGGAYRAFWCKLSDLASTETPTVGAGGAAVSGSNGNGNQGGSSSFTINGTTITVVGGTGGTHGADGTSQTGGSGASVYDVTTGTLAFDGATGGNGNGPNAIDSGAAGGGTNAGTPGNGGNSERGGGGGGAAGNAGAVGTAGTSKLGGDGGVGANGSGTGGNGQTATGGIGGGGGGGGARNGCTASGAGGNGKIRVTVFAVNS